MSAVTPLYDKIEPDTTRGLTASVWRQSLEAYVSNNPAFGIRIKDDFTVPMTNASTSGAAVNSWWMEDSAAGGTSEAFSSIAASDGIAVLSATTGTVQFGAEAHYGDAATTLGLIATPVFGNYAGTTPSAATIAKRRGRVVYEARVDLGVLDQFFIGLTEPIGTFLSATSTLPTDSDYIGFYRFNDGALRFVVANDNNAGTAVTDEITLLTAAQMDALESATAGVNFFKLAFAINDQPGGPSVPSVSYDVSVNGTWYGSLAKTLDPLACPTEFLTPRFAVTAGTTVAPATVSMPVDSVDVFVAGIN